MSMIRQFNDHKKLEKWLIGLSIMTNGRSIRISELSNYFGGEICSLHNSDKCKLCYVAIVLDNEGFCCDQLYCGTIDNLYENILKNYISECDNSILLHGYHRYLQFIDDKIKRYNKLKAFA